MNLNVAVEGLATKELGTETIPMVLPYIESNWVLGANGQMQLEQQVRFNVSFVTTTVWEFSDGSSKIQIAKSEGPLYLPQAVSPPLIPELGTQKLFLTGTWTKRDGGGYLLVVSDSQSDKK